MNSGPVWQSIGAFTYELRTLSGESYSDLETVRMVLARGGLWAGSEEAQFQGEKCVTTSESMVNIPMLSADWLKGNTHLLTVNAPEKYLLKMDIDSIEHYLGC